mmetsp:Transcript_27596/g.68793  ORF Transcript_27596/g.68793 Transcript_27596/m.68793 type:complete len:208 (+) Transcript_27596:148-771(+)
MALPAADDNRSYEDLLRNIHTIKTTNEDIIDGLNARMRENEKVVVGREMELQLNQRTLRWEPTWKDTKRPIRNIIREHRATVRLHDIKPIFDSANDKLDIDISRTTWLDDVERLNDQMAPIADKYRMFAGTGPSMEVLRQFEENYAGLQDALGALHAKTIHADLRAKQRECEAKIKRINEAMQQLKKSVEDLEYSADDQEWFLTGRL